MTTGTIREFQRTELASAQGDTCLAELVALPSPSTAHWIYGAHADLPELASRVAYYESMIPRRRTALRRLINAYAPRYIVFLSSGYRDHWNAIAGRQLPIWPQPPIRDESTGAKMLVAKHPSSHGTTNAEYTAIGEALAE